MAGSGLPPLPNIPYCCLPQESGPCLSTSVGDRPLRSPTHRRLGGPSPRLLSNGTHARPPPRLRLARMEMPPQGRTRYYPACPPAIPGMGAGCIRVTHPSATLIPRRGFTVRLACIRPAASVHPEPGSNSSLYYCLALFFSESRVSASRRIAAPLCSLLGSYCWHPFGCLCWPQTFKELPLNSFHNPCLPFVFSGCKSTTFFRIDKHFFRIFFKILLCH